MCGIGSSSQAALSAVRDALDKLGRQARQACTELCEALEASGRNKMKQLKAAHQMKLAASRTAGRIELSQRVTAAGHDPGTSG